MNIFGLGSPGFNLANPQVVDPTKKTSGLLSGLGISVGTPGQWEVFGQRLPDFGLTEAAFASAPQNPLVKNPPRTVDPTAQITRIQGDNEPSPTTPPTTPPPGGGETPGDTELQQLIKMSQSPGGLNPSQNSRLAQLLGVSGQTTGPSIDELRTQADRSFNPIIQGIQDFINTLQPGGQREQALTNPIEEAYKNLTGLLPGEKEGLLGQIGQQRQQFGYEAQSALGDVTRAVNALVQQGLSRFGAGSSAGLASTELAAQELARQLGGLNQQSLQGNLQFSQNEQNVEQFISTKKTELDNWLADAKSKIQLTLQDQIAQANRDKRYTEAQREALKMDALRDAQQFVRQIDIMNAGHLQQLDLFKQAASGIGGRQIDPNQMGNAIFDRPQTTLPTAGGESTQIPRNANTAFRGSRSAVDELSSLLAGGFGNNRDQFGGLIG